VGNCTTGVDIDSAIEKTQCEGMGHQRRIKQLRRELKQMRRKNQQEEIYFAGKYKVSSAVAEEPIPDGDQDQIADLEQIDEDEEINAIKG
jgi:hypothetical protein